MKGRQVQKTEQGYPEAIVKIISRKVTADIVMNGVGFVAGIGLILTGAFMPMESLVWVGALVAGYAFGRGVSIADIRNFRRDNVDD